VRSGKIRFVIPAFLLALPHAAQAGAWPQEPGHGQLINSFSYYEVNVQGYDGLGKPSGHGAYTQLEFAPYLEYGLTDRLTIGAQPRVQEVTQTGLPFTGHSFGLVQFNIFARYTLYHDDYNAVSIQAQAGIPGSATTHNPELAEPNAEYELRALYGRGLTFPNGWTGFIDSEAGYRLETNGNANEIRVDFTFGVTPLPNWSFFAQSFNTISTGAAPPGSIDYDLYRVQLSGLRKLTSSLSLQFGAWDDVGGRNISRGAAGIVALWYQF
jgi:hypothetical protein